MVAVNTNMGVLRCYCSIRLVSIWLHTYPFARIMKTGSPVIMPSPITLHMWWPITIKSFAVAFSHVLVVPSVIGSNHGVLYLRPVQRPSILFDWRPTLIINIR